ncbi:CPBP family intramembrane glutamic endopeptidase [Winogradskyella vincentii]|uniref:CPBP family intramembrane metalloprotease n=1 Tax=Winogradskyella vincentii TaxID=2877122 RepID=A0ABS7XYU4_9FLAO|nr:CPBP family intramembrane glutamic endopeptidase [Winogradskyella vincentii]MCA0152829.1 CPBP family intramembrane metalloprotease [Winogradskyella vincentii]
MNSNKFKLFELFLLFIIIPVVFSVDAIGLVTKLIAGVIGFLYVIWVLLKVEKNKFEISKNIKWKRFWVQTLIRLIVIIIITTCYVAVMAWDHLFIVLLNKPILWIAILFIYSLFSVYPQELIFRTFFFQRYEALIKNKTLFIYLNAVLFSLAHLFFKNSLVILLTFIGGLLFAHTYYKTKSTLLVSLEHAIYGCWLFTIGMGAMLGFPT